MPNTARGDVRPPALFDGDEITTLTTFLDYLRDSILAKIDGLDESQTRTELVPTGTSLLQLLKHLATTEQSWMRRYFLGEDIEYTPKDHKLSDDDTVEGIVYLYTTTGTQTSEILRHHSDPNELAQRSHPNYPGVPSLRWILVHLVEETARHAGHADILREQIDGTTGR